MEHDATLFEQETTALLHHEAAELEDTRDSPPNDSGITAQQQDFTPQYVLPIALLTALAMASTSATSYFAFATLLCKDARRCQGEETAKYAGFVAGATCTANILGISALGYLGLLLWMVCRSMSAVVLLVGGEQSSTIHNLPELHHFPILSFFSDIELFFSVSQKHLRRPFSPHLRRTRLRQPTPLQPERRIHANYE
jgi:hypothetical protein